MFKIIQYIDINNFKAWESLSISFGKVTGLFGTNSSGKSSLIQMLLLFKQTKNTTDRNIVLDFGDSKKLVNLGTFNDVIHKHDNNKRLTWSLEWDTSELIKISDPTKSSKSVLFEGERLKIHCETYLKNDVLTVDSLSYKFNENEFKIQPKKVEGTEFVLHSSLDQSQGALFSPGTSVDSRISLIISVICFVCRMNFVYICSVNRIKI